jgi:hypothetical protein
MRMMLLVIIIHIRGKLFRRTDNDVIRLVTWS